MELFYLYQRNYIAFTEEDKVYSKNKLGTRPNFNMM